jgi:nicotinate-nucleotide--dimethylbenzimidazole phosphoribosyltransferase
MDADEFLGAIDIGYHTVPPDSDLLVVGEMGIANTTAAATLCAALLGGGAVHWAGRGTGVDDAGLSRKRAAIDAALEHHRAISGDPLKVVGAMGGRELAAIAGAVLAARRHKIPVLLDGFVATAAIVPLMRLNDDAVLAACARDVGLDPVATVAAPCWVNSASAPGLISACGSAKRRVPASPSCCCARH